MTYHVTSTRPWAGLAVLVLPCLLVSMDSHVLNLATPAIARDLRPSGAELLWIVDGYVFLVAGSLLAMGILGDRIGRRRLLLAGVTLFAASSVAAALARTPAQLIGARLMMGLAGASLMPSTLALIRTMFADRRQRAVAIGLWTASFSLGGLIGPIAGGVLLEHFWWGALFLPAVPVAALLLALGPRLLPESSPETTRRFDVPGMVLSLCAVLCLVHGVKLAAAGGDLREITASLLLGAASASSFVRRQRRARTALLDATLFHTTEVRIALLSNGLTFFTLYATQVAVAQYLQWGTGLTALDAGLWTLPSVLVYLLAAALGPAAVRRFHPAAVIVTGLTAITLGCALFALVAVTPGDLAPVVAGGCLFSAGLGPVYAVSTELIVSSAREENAGTASAVAETTAELGGALGIALLGSLGVTVYRHAAAGTPSGASHTPGDAAATAASLPADQAATLMTAAREAFTASFATIGGAAALIMAAVTITVAISGRRFPR